MYINIFTIFMRSDFRINEIIDYCQIFLLPFAKIKPSIHPTIVITPPTNAKVLMSKWDNGTVFGVTSTAKG